jgi:hypothetical protein
LRQAWVSWFERIMRTLLLSAALLLTACPDKKTEVKKEVQAVTNEYRDSRQTGDVAANTDCATACKRIEACDPKRIDPQFPCVPACETLPQAYDCEAAATTCEEYKKCLEP